MTLIIPNHHDCEIFRNSLDLLCSTMDDKDPYKKRVEKELSIMNGIIEPKPLTLTHRKCDIYIKALILLKNITNVENPYKREVEEKLSLFRRKKRKL